MYDYSIKKKKTRSNRLFGYVVILIFLLFLGSKVIGLFANEKVESPIPQNSNGTVTQIKNKDEAIERIKKIISNKPGTYSVLVSNLKSGETFGINQSTIFTAASVNKVATLAVLYQLADTAEIDLDKTITLQENDVQNYGTGSIRYDKPGTVYSLKTLARLTMEKSDNTAHYLLSEQIIGVSKIQDQIDQWGLSQTNIKLNKTSNSDQEKLFRLIYEGKIAGEALTKEMIDFMDDSDFEDRIPALLPKDIPVYHKIGNEVRNTHDVGIVDLPKGPYYIGVFTSDNPDEQQAINIVAQISKIVYDYFLRS